jgi:hypothetical protein
MPTRNLCTGDQRNSERVFRNLAAGFGTVLVLTAMWLALYIPWPDAVTILGFDGQPLTMLGTDATPQKRAHLLGMLALGLVGLIILFCPSTKLGRRTASLAAMVSYVSVLLGLSIALLSLHWVATAALPPTTSIGLHGGVFGAFANPSRTLILATMTCTLLFAPILLMAARRQPSILWWSLAIVYSAFLLVAGFFGPILLNGLSPEQVGWIESHFDAVIGAKRTLADGVQDRDFGYSLLFNVVQASMERFTGPLSFATDIRVLQAGNVAFVAATLWAAYLWNAAKPILAVLTVVLVLPWVHNDFLGLFFPNQAGWRYIAFPLAVIAMRLAHGRRPLAMALPFGFFAAWAILWNTETGVAATVALLVRLAAAAERISLRELSGIFVHFFFGLLAGVAFVVLLYRLGLGRWPDFHSIFLDLLTRGQGLSRGRTMYLDPLAILVAAYALWFVLRGAAIRRLSPLASKPADRAALGMMILVWSGYFVQQPHPWNLWSYMLPFGLLLGDTLFSIRWPRNWKRNWKPAAVRITIPVAALAFLVAPNVVTGNYQAVGSVWHSIEVKKSSASEAPLLSGVRLSREVVEALQQKLDSLAAVPSGAWIFTENVYLVPKLSERRDLNVVHSVYWTSALAEFNRLVDRVRSSSPPALVFDDPATLAPGEFIQRYFLHLQKVLEGQYHHEKTIAGWSIWRRN